ncbi:MAG: alpha/beta hydrolase [Acidobacteriota bacterium]
MNTSTTLSHQGADLCVETSGEGPLSYGQQERDAIAVLDELGVERCAVVGFSDGGITGLRLAARGLGRVQAAATVGSRWPARDSAHLGEAFPEIRRKTLEGGAQAQLLEDYDRLNPDQDFDRLAELYSAMWKDDGPDGHPDEAAVGIEAPTLLAVGDRDPFVPAEAVLELHRRRLEAENPSELLVLPGAGHAAHDERGTSTCRRCGAFWREISGARGGYQTGK